MFLLGSAKGQSFKTLLDFDSSNGANSAATLVEGADGMLYGAAYTGGDNDKGTVFKMSVNGTQTPLHSFDGIDGQNPFGGLVVGEFGSLYGTTYVGGEFGQQVNGYGVVYRISNAGAFSVLLNFAGNNGANPEEGLATSGNSSAAYFGTTRFGGNSGLGTVFRTTHAGTVTTLHSFDLSDGEWPIGGVVIGDDGNLYGTTCGGGVNFAGIIFRVTPSGSFTSLHDFDPLNGQCPVAALVRGNDGYFYGTADGGGSSNAGTIFRISPSGTFTLLHSFDHTDGNGPGGLCLGSDGNYYGATSNGGAHDKGTLFRVTPSGVVTTLHDFDGTDGQNPYAGLVQHTNGTLYGVTYSGGATGYGTVFSLNMGLPAFVSLQSAMGLPGMTVGVFGQGLKGTNAVAFNGVQASFNVYSDNYLVAWVPSGATSGFVKVTTKQGTLTSAQKFHVK